MFRSLTAFFVLFSAGATGAASDFSFSDPANRPTAEQLAALKPGTPCRLQLLPNAEGDPASSKSFFGTVLSANADGVNLRLYQQAVDTLIEETGISTVGILPVVKTTNAISVKSSKPDVPERSFEISEIASLTPAVDLDRIVQFRSMVERHVTPEELQALDAELRTFYNSSPRGTSCRIEFPRKPGVLKSQGHALTGHVIRSERDRFLFAVDSEQWSSSPSAVVAKTPGVNRMYKGTSARSNRGGAQQWITRGEIESIASIAEEPAYAFLAMPPSRVLLDQTLVPGGHCRVIVPPATDGAWRGYWTAYEGKVVAVRDQITVNVEVVEHKEADGAIVGVPIPGKSKEFRNNGVEFDSNDPPAVDAPGWIREQEPDARKMRFRSDAISEAVAIEPSEAR